MSGRAQGVPELFDSLSGKRRGRKVGHPRFRSRKDNRQSIRLTRNGFGVTARGVRVAKVGDVRLEWSRDLPAVPSSVTVIREADGWYYASFVVEVQATPLPVSAIDVGVDLGLTSAAGTTGTSGRLSPPAGGSVRPFPPTGSPCCTARSGKPDWTGTTNWLSD